ncbi:MAG: hypothetical protein JXQ81_02365 [Desulfuromonadales bacterium]|nr:hypothetical protein [Desulfuromonadales bacterium]
MLNCRATMYSENSKLLNGKPFGFGYHFLRLLLVAVFLWSGISKGFHPNDFSAIVGAYGLLPDILVFPVAISLIVSEIIAAVGLLLEKRGALSLITLMMLLFLAVLAYGIHLGLDIDCGCFGPNDPEAEAFHDLRGALHRDLLLMLAIGYLYLWRFINRPILNPWVQFHRRRALPKEV